MKKFCIVLLVLLAASQAVSAGGKSDNGKVNWPLTATVNSGLAYQSDFYVTLRAEPSRDAKAVGTLLEKTPVSVIGAGTGFWVEVTQNDQKGYIIQEALNLKKGRWPAPNATMVWVVPTTEGTGQYLLAAPQTNAEGLVHLSSNNHETGGLYVSSIAGDWVTIETAKGYHGYLQKEYLKEPAGGWGVNIEETIQKTAQADDAWNKAKPKNYGSVSPGVGFLMLVLYAVFIVTLITITSKRSITEYYALKRPKYPFLQKWIAEHGDPEKTTRALIKESKWEILACYIGSCVLILPIQLFARSAYASAAASLPKFILLSAVIMGAPIVFSYRGAKDRRRGEDECPQCGCPKSWERIHEEMIILDSQSYTTTTQRETVGGDFVDRMYDAQSKKTTETEVVYYKILNDFKCADCGHTDHIEQKGKYKIVNGRAKGDPDPKISYPYEKNDAAGSIVPAIIGAAALAPVGIWVLGFLGVIYFGGTGFLTGGWVWEKFIAPRRKAA